MQKQQKGVQWIVAAVESGRINPLHPDMSIIPDDILYEIGWEETPEGEVIPKQAAMDLGMFLFFHAKMGEMIKQHQKLSAEVIADVNEVLSAVECFAMLASLEQLRRADLLDYWPSSEGGADASWGRENQVKHGCPAVSATRNEQLKTDGNRCGIPPRRINS